MTIPLYQIRVSNETAKKISKCFKLNRSVLFLSSPARGRILIIIVLFLCPYVCQCVNNLLTY